MERFFDFLSLTPESTHMFTFLFSPWGIPANYRHMQGSSVNTYKWVNTAGKGVLVKYHWVPEAGVKNLTQMEADKIQSTNFNHATEDLYNAIKMGEFPEWELQVQIMSDGEHPELDFDPLDDTKIWPEEKFPQMPVGRMVLNRNPENYFAEVEQAAFGTGVLVDGLEFSDDKMLQGRTLSYSDTQRYRVGPNYLQLPINRPKVPVATNQRDGQMTYYVDHGGGNHHMNYEPNSFAPLKEAAPDGAPHTPMVQGKLVREKISRTNDFKQAGERWRKFEAWERDELISNLVCNLKMCKKDIQERIIANLKQADAEYAQRVIDGLANAKQMMEAKPEMAKPAAAKV